MPHAARVVLTAWSPTWEGPVEQWTKKYIKKHRWRCDLIYEFDDLLQEGYILFDKISRYYPRAEPRQFMALYKMSYANLINDKSSYMQRKKRCHDELPTDVSELWSHMGETTNTGFLSVLLSEAPQELRLALALIAENQLEAPVTPKEPRENLNMKLRRILGLADTFDLKDALYDLLFN
jgi:hypothetical protein